MTYRAIRPEPLIETIDRLQRRIVERFAARGLAQVCTELGDVARRDRERVLALKRPYLWVRIGVGALVALGLFALIFLIRDVKGPAVAQLLLPDGESGAALALFQGIDSAVNVVLLFGAGLFFLLRHEERDKRRLALDDLYELRSLAHVIDMHQLTKDPTVLLSGEERTPSAPKEQMTAFELVRYLDYCSEMLSLLAKVAALYAQDMRDPVVIETVSDIESMTTNLSRKIWQKIILVEQMDASRAG